MQEIGPRRFRAANLLAAVACAAALWWSFVVGASVPLLSYVDMALHEVGHLMLAWTPGIGGPLAGAIVQVGVPLGLALYFGFARHETYSTALLLAWTGTSAQNVSVFVPTASLQSLPLLGSGQRDWSFIFASLGHAEWAAPASEAVKIFGLLAVLVGLGVALFGLLAPLVEKVPSPPKLATDPASLAALPRRLPRNGGVSAMPVRDAGETPPRYHGLGQSR
jgi:hypothetical protein